MTCKQLEVKAIQGKRNTHIFPVLRICFQALTKRRLSRVTFCLTQHSHCWCYVMTFSANREHLRDIDWGLVTAGSPQAKQKDRLGGKTSLQLSQQHNSNHQLQEELCHLQRVISALLLEGQCWKMRGSTDEQNYPLKLIHNTLEPIPPFQQNSFSHYTEFHCLPHWHRNSDCARQRLNSCICKGIKPTHLLTSALFARKEQ